MAAYTGHQNAFRKLTKAQRHELGQIAPVAQTHAVCADCGGDKGLSKTTRDGQVVSVCAGCKVTAMAPKGIYDGSISGYVNVKRDIDASAWRAEVE